MRVVYKNAHKRILFHVKYKFCARLCVLFVFYWISPLIINVAKWNLDRECIIHCATLFKLHIRRRDVFHVCWSIVSQEHQILFAIGVWKEMFRRGSSSVRLFQMYPLCESFATVFVWKISDNYRVLPTSYPWYKLSVILT